MKKERLIIPLGILVALVFFYLGLNEWLKTKEEQIKPPPVVVKPAPVENENQQPSSEETPPQKTTEQEQKQPQPEEDIIAQNIKEEKKGLRCIERELAQKNIEWEEKSLKPQKDNMEKEITQKSSKKRNIAKTEPKTYTVQVGAFMNKEGAQKTAEKAKGMGYKVNIVEEDNFYKVRLTVHTNDINRELTKLRRVFGSALVRR